MLDVLTLNSVIQTIQDRESIVEETVDKTLPIVQLIDEESTIS